MTPLLPSEMWLVVFDFLVDWNQPCNCLKMVCGLMAINKHMKEDPIVKTYFHKFWKSVLMKISHYNFTNFTRIEKLMESSTVSYRMACKKLVTRILKDKKPFSQPLHIIVTGGSKFLLGQFHFTTFRPQKM